MYAPKFAQNTDPSAVKSFIKENGFGILVSLAGGHLWATHIPMMLSEDETKLLGHIAKANKQWKDFDTSGEVLAIFNGPHTYVSSSWYDHENVPSWNYVAVHVYGSIQILEGEALYASIKHLLDKYEKVSACPVSMEKMSPEYLKREMNGLVGFEISITKVEASFKLSQNRDDVNHESIITELEKRGDPSSVEIASLMRNNRSTKK